MLRIRRVTALLTPLLLIHLVMASAWSACPMASDAMTDTASTTHGAHAAPATTPARHGARMPSSEQGHQRSDDCQTSCAMVACSAAGHCASWTERQPGQLAVAAAAGALRPASVPTEAPLSSTTAPEPPPPRAV